jgi:hypothetical protein
VVRGPRSVAVVRGIMGSRANRISIRQSLELRKWRVKSLKLGDREKEKMGSPTTRANQRTSNIVQTTLEKKIPV